LLPHEPVHAERIAKGTSVSFRIAFPFGTALGAAPNDNAFVCSESKGRKVQHAVVSTTESSSAQFGLQLRFDPLPDLPLGFADIMRPAIIEIDHGDIEAGKMRSLLFEAGIPVARVAVHQLGDLGKHVEITLDPVARGLFQVQAVAANDSLSLIHI